MNEPPQRSGRSRGPLGSADGLQGIPVPVNSVPRYRDRMALI